ncbi:MAG: hypothetical protein Q8R98_29995 [Rubrivivax sp.]|nr:hypothetical protein [Rubrivivax sp.]MDP3616092.1 hypothetical protein [Rubrivivax sp.]
MTPSRYTPWYPPAALAPVHLHAPPEQVPVPPPPLPVPEPGRPNPRDPDTPPEINEPSLPGQHAPVRDPLPPTRMH